MQRNGITRLIRKFYTLFPHIMKKTLLLLFGLSLVVLGGCSFIPQNSWIPTTGSQCLPTTAPWIKVVSPNGGETFTAGQQITVKWESCNIQPAPSAGEDAIMINLRGLVSDGQSSNEFIAQVHNDGQSIITLPTSISEHPMLYGKNFKIAVSRGDLSAQSKTIGDLSDNSFTINPNTDSNKQIITQTKAENLVHQTWGDCSQGDCGGVVVTVSQGNIVTAIFTERSDSTSRSKKESVATYQNGIRVLGQPVITQECQRGHSDGAIGFSSSPCI